MLSNLYKISQLHNLQAGSASSFHILVRELRAASAPIGSVVVTPSQG
ncbi:hypothetical protein RI496_02895 [Aeromonas dhakensis]|nr:hypothetical protein [Aeromonas dhakensis]UCM43215.1 hypothetical protein LEO73_11530 [Aeromonas dhakensis]